MSPDEDFAQPIGPAENQVPGARRGITTGVVIVQLRYDALGLTPESPSE